MKPIIEVKRLIHRYGERTAINDLSFSIQAGEVLGLLGPNGAGKTTTVRLLNGLLTPVSGEMRVLGFDPRTNGQEIRRLTGVLTETPALYERLSARQNLEFFGTLAGMSRDEIRERSDELLQFFELTERANDRVGGYSKGMKQRMALARALLHRPEVIFLDEPTSGLDPEAARQVHELIHSVLQKEGRTVLLATHRLEEAERLCDRVAILNQGKLLALGTLAELRQQAAPGIWVEIAFWQAAPLGLAQELGSLEGMLALDSSTPIWRVQMDREAHIPGMVAQLVKHGAEILAVRPQKLSLEDIYFRVQKQNGGQHEG
jgi:ABC-2 type transport system ATP-binding protein